MSTCRRCKHPVQNQDQERMTGVEVEDDTGTGGLYDRGSCHQWFTRAADGSTAPAVSH